MINPTATKMTIYCSMLICVIISAGYAEDPAPQVGANPFGRISLPQAPVVEELDQPVSVPEVKPELFVETVTLKFLDAISFKTVLEAMSSPYGRINTDMRSNSLIICDSNEVLEKILLQIEKADRSPEQVMIEVVILDVKIEDDTEIGVNWDILSDNIYDVGYRQNFTTARIGSTIEDSTTIGNATAFNSTGLGGAFSLVSGTIRNVVHLIQEKRDVEILASPRVMMVSGRSATIDAVEEIPYTEVTDSSDGGAAALTSTEFKDVGVKLDVEAIVIDDDHIFLTVESEQKVTTGQSATEVPVVDARKATSSLMLKDGEVVMFGGLRRQEKTVEVDQIPLLGDIPILGFLFKSNNTVIKNSELLVLISPHIYRDEQISKEAMAKFDEITQKPLLKFPAQ